MGAGSGIRTRRVLASLLTLGGLATLVVGGAAPAQAAGSDDKEALSQRYAPVVRLVHQTEPCGHGEPYRFTRDTEVAALGHGVASARRNGMRALGIDAVARCQRLSRWLAA